MPSDAAGRAGVPRRQFLAGVTAVALLVISCASGRRRLGGGGRGDDAGRDSRSDRRSVDGHLRAQPGPSGTSTATAPQAGLETLDLGEGTTVLLYLPPSGPAEEPVPLVVLFHGAGGTAEDGLAILRPLADEAGLILLATSSRGRTWDLVLGGYGPDVAVLDAALVEVFDRHVIDPHRLAVAGFSDGASYALSIGANNGQLFSHVMAFSPGFWVPGDTEGAPSFFVTHGTDDQVLPIDATSRRLVPRLEQAGYDVRYQEFAGGHVVPGDLAAATVMWFLDQGR